MAGSTSARLLQSIAAEIDAIDPGEEQGDPALVERLHAAAVRAVEGLGLLEQDDSGHLTVDQAAELAHAVVLEAAASEVAPGDEAALARVVELARLRDEVDRRHADPRTVAATPARDLVRTALRRHLPGARR